MWGGRLAGQPWCQLIPGPEIPFLVSAEIPVSVIQTDDRADSQLERADDKAKRIARAGLRRRLTIRYGERAAQRCIAYMVVDAWGL